MRHHKRKRRQLSLGQWTRSIAWPFGEEAEIALWLQVIGFVPTLMLLAGVGLLFSSVVAFGCEEHPLQELAHAGDSALVYHLTALVFMIPFVTLRYG